MYMFILRIFCEKRRPYTIVWPPVHVLGFSFKQMIHTIPKMISTMTISMFQSYTMSIDGYESLSYIIRNKNHTSHCTKYLLGSHKRKKKVMEIIYKKQVLTLRLWPK